MNKSLILSLMLVIIQYNTSFPQQDSVQWNKLIKQHKNVEIVYDDYIDKFWGSLYSTPLVFVDTILVLNSEGLDKLPSPADGIEKLIKSIQYPIIATRAGIEGSVVLSASVDTSGSLNNLEVKFSNPGLLQYSVIDILKNTRFIPAMRKGISTNVQIAIAFSFVLYQKKNIQINTIIANKSTCLVTCPAYKITLDKNGEVIYEGHYNVDKLGKWKSRIHKSEFEGLKSLIFAINFFGMKESYATEVSDLAWISIQVITPAITKKVSSDYYLPLWELGKLIDYITQDLKWEKVEE